MTTSPVSVVIPAHNAERFVAEAIDSVLAQSVLTELIVVDDGSTDATGAIVDAYGSALHCIHQAQRGVSGARNRGLAAAHHEWIAFLDADDRWEPGKLERQCAVLAAHQDVDMVFGHYLEFTSDEGDGEGLIARTELAPGYHACAMLARRTLFERVGGFSETVRIGEFIDWYGRALGMGARAVVLDDVVFHRRVHRSNMTRVAVDKREQYLGVIRAHLNRQRPK